MIISTIIFIIIIMIMIQQRGWGVCSASCLQTWRNGEGSPRWTSNRHYHYHIDFDSNIHIYIDIEVDIDIDVDVYIDMFF